MFFIQSFDWNSFPEECEIFPATRHIEAPVALGEHEYPLDVV